MQVLIVAGAVTASTAVGLAVAAGILRLTLRALAGAFPIDRS